MSPRHYSTLVLEALQHRLHGGEGFRLQLTGQVAGIGRWPSLPEARLGLSITTSAAGVAMPLRQNEPHVGDPSRLDPAPSSAIAEHLSLDREGA